MQEGRNPSTVDRQIEVHKDICTNIHTDKQKHTDKQTDRRTVQKYRYRLTNRYVQKDEYSHILYSK
jgi:hypothetical protein